MFSFQYSPAWKTRLPFLLPTWNCGKLSSWWVTRWLFQICFFSQDYLRIVFKCVVQPPIRSETFTVHVAGFWFSNLHFHTILSRRFDVTVTGGSCRFVPLWDCFDVVSRWVKWFPERLFFTRKDYTAWRWANAQWIGIFPSKWRANEQQRWGLSTDQIRCCALPWICPLPRGSSGIFRDEPTNAQLMYN